MQVLRRLVRSLALAAGCSTCCGLAAHAQATSPVAARWQAVFDTSAQYYSWTNSVGSSGAQIYMPAGFKLTGRPVADWKHEYLLRSGYMNTRQSTNGGRVHTEAMTDTAVGGTWTYYGWNGLQPFAAMNINIPTARWTAGGAPGTVATTRTDSDIVRTPILGEGWNWAPSVGTNISISESTIVSLGFGYTNRGPFSGTLPSGLVSSGAARFNPGDVYTMTVGYGWTGDRDNVQLSFAYSIETTSYQNDAPLYRAGDRIIVGAKAGHTWDERWATKGSFNYSHFSRNDVAMAGVPALVTETFNSNSDVYRASLEHIYSKDNYSIGPSVTWLYRDRNGYDPTTFQFIPAKTSWSAGLGAAIAPTPAINLTFKAERIWVHESSNPDKIIPVAILLAGSGRPATVNDAWVATIGGSVKM